jgi:putative peptidoglycan lipid II flippase
MGLLLAVMAVGLPFFSVVSLMVRAFYAVKDTRTPLRVAVADFVINIAVSLVLIRYLGLVGIVIASTTSIIAQAVLLERALVRRLPDMNFAPLLPSLGKVALGTGVMAGVVEAGWIGARSLGLGAAATALIGVVGLIPAGVAAYGLTLWKLRIEGRNEIEAMLVRMPLVGRLFRPAL